MTMSDLLTKLVLHEKKIVTYRTLSRQQSIHVNQAKNELSAFYQVTQSSKPSSLHATFIVTGLVVAEPKVTNGAADDEMDIDGPSSSQTQELDTGGWGANRIVLCTEEALESTKASFARVRSVHVYSLSAAPVKDPSILSTTLESVRTADASASQDQLRAFGIVVGDVSAITTKPSAKGKGKAAEAPAPVPPPAKPAPVEKKAEVPEKKSGSRNGTLNFGGAKAKEQPKLVKEPKAEVKKEEPESKKTDKLAAPPSRPSRSVSSSSLKRGRVVSDDEGEAADVKPTTKPTKSSSKVGSTAKPKSKQSLSVKAAYEDDEREEEEDDDDGPVRPGARKANGKPHKAKSAKEASLAAMFDDSSDVEMQPPPPPEEEKEEKVDEVAQEEEPDEVAEEPDDSESGAIDKKTKRKAKAKPKDGAIVKKDGKKKRRVVKSKMTTNERGYMVMEDYSEYETVSESEELTVPDKPKKTTTKKETKPKEDESRPKPKPKTAPSGGAKKAGGKLMDYFNKK